MVSLLVEWFKRFASQTLLQAPVFSKFFLVLGIQFFFDALDFLHILFRSLLIFFQEAVMLVHLDNLFHFILSWDYVSSSIWPDCKKGS
jgi:hypothetical protein